MTSINFSLNGTALLANADSFIFSLDPQLLFTLLTQGIAIFLLFLFLSYVLIDPVRKVLEDRQNKVTSDLADAARDKEDAAKLKEEYDAKLKAADDEASEILSTARRKAVKNEESIVAEAKAEANRIISRANQEAELEKNKVRDEVKQEIIGVAAVMAGKLVEGSMNEAKQAELIDETLKEMGDSTWLNK